MRTTIRATCHCCGDVELGVEALIVTVDAPTDATAYAFACPLCARANHHPVSRRIADLLVSSGARLEVVDARDAWTLPLEQTEHPTRSGASVADESSWASLDVDAEVADFSAWLAGDTWLAELLAGS